MPGYGLEPRQRESLPWDIPAHLLMPAKVITDPLPHDVYLTEIERLLLDSPPMQRLRRIRQLGTAQLVYPGAVHNRFSHVLGTLRKAQDLLDAVLGYRSRLSPSHDLFAQWESELDQEEFDRRVAEIVVLTRLGALLHDLCHVAFGHTIEDDLGILTPHDANVERFERFWAEMPADLVPEPLAYHLKPLIISKGGGTLDPHNDPEYKYPFVDDLVGNTICADLLDYLGRDHFYTGLPMSLGTRFLDNFYVTSEMSDPKARVVLRLVRGGRVRHDILTEVLKHLRYRFEETERVLFHKTKLAADVMLGHLLSCAFDVAWREELARALSGEASAQQYAKWLDENGVGRVELAEALRRHIAGEVVAAELTNGTASGVPVPAPVLPLSDVASVDEASGKPALGSKRWFAMVDVAARSSIETMFRQRGDDGILEHFAYDWAVATGDGGAAASAEDGDRATKRTDRAGATGVEALRERTAGLALDLLERRLYKHVGTSSLQSSQDQDLDSLRERFVATFGGPKERMELEHSTSAFVGCPDDPAVLLWIPSTKMRLKPADVLVDKGDGCIPLKEYQLPGEGKPGESWRIVGEHRNLWACQVFVRGDLAEMAPLVRGWLSGIFRSKGFDGIWDGVSDTQLVTLLANRGVAAMAGLLHEQYLRLQELMSTQLEASARQAGGTLRQPSFQDVIDSALLTLRAEIGGPQILELDL